MSDTDVSPRKRGAELLCATFLAYIENGETSSQDAAILLEEIDDLPMSDAERFEVLLAVSAATFMGLASVFGGGVSECLRTLLAWGVEP